MLPQKLQTKIQKRRDENSLRHLGEENKLVDFSSNDYIGFSKSKTIFENTHKSLAELSIHDNGASGSRLLTGNHKLYSIVEKQLAQIHQSEDALIFNSGYDANVGFFSCVPQRGDVILYDEYIHASIRDGITISKAEADKFKHNDLVDLRGKLARIKTEGQIYIATESVFSMDGDSPELVKMVRLCQENKAHLIVDEAHAVGVFGKNGIGLCQELKIHDKIFARLVTFGKAMGCHGAAILCNSELKEYLFNYARSIIYTTGLPPHNVATIGSAYSELKKTLEIDSLHKNIQYFKDTVLSNRLSSKFIPSESAIQSCIISGNDEVKLVASSIKEAGFNVKPILYPSVAKGHERLRFCIHSYNKPKEIKEVLSILSNFVGQKMSPVNER